VAEAVVDLLDYDPDFESTLDSEQTRRFVQFTGSVYNRDTDTFMVPHPDMRLSMSTGYRRPKEDFAPTSTRDEFVEFATAMKANPTWEETGIFAALAGPRLDTLAASVHEHMSSIRVIFSVTESWLKTFYTLLHFARAFFGCNQYEEFVLWYGNGGNGKDMLQTWMRHIFGGYAGTFDNATLCANMDPTKGAPDLRRSVGKRLVCCSEVPHNRKLCTDTLKKLRDQRGAPIRARFLNENDRVFHPSFLLCICFNDERHFDCIDGGLLRGVVAQSFPFHFAEKPEKPLDRPINTDLKDEGFVLGHLDEMFFIFKTLYQVFLKGDTDRVVTVAGVRPTEIDEYIKSLSSTAASGSSGADLDPLSRTIQGMPCTTDRAAASKASAVKAYLRIAHNGIGMMEVTSRLAAEGWVEQVGSSKRTISKGEGLATTHMVVPSAPTV
jgi:hypothetical protein